MLRTEVSWLLSRKASIHLFALLSLLALFGWTQMGSDPLLVLAALSGYGALCSAFSYTNQKIEPSARNMARRSGE